MMAVPAGLGVMAGMECIDGSATYLQQQQQQAETHSSGSSSMRGHQSYPQLLIPEVAAQAGSEARVVSAMGYMRMDCQENKCPW